MVGDRKTIRILKLLTVGSMSHAMYYLVCNFELSIAYYPIPFSQSCNLYLRPKAQRIMNNTHGDAP